MAGRGCNPSSQRLTAEVAQSNRADGELPSGKLPANPGSGKKFQDPRLDASSDTLDIDS